MRPLVTAALMHLACTAAAEDPWRSLPPLPDAEGFAGAFAGVSQGRLLVAGGTNFPDKRPWEGGSKVWYDAVYALDRPDGRWQQVGRLPQANGYGVSVSSPEGLICAGGGNADRHFREVFVLSCQDGSLTTRRLPDLPQPCAFMAGALLHGSLYVTGGQVSPATTEALPSLWRLDLSRPQAGWQTLPPCPGPARILAVLGAQGDSLYLFSGAALSPGSDGKAQRQWLSDAWRYTPDRGWQPLAELPRVAVAAPSPAPSLGGHLLVLGGDDGANAAFEPKDRHPGFPREILAYHPGSDSWGGWGDLPFSLVTTPAVLWRGEIVIPGGEARPGKRSPAVWSGRLTPP